jgi:hypothetical protein
MVRPSGGPHLQRRFLSLALAVSVVALCLVACQGDGEGQRCEYTDDPGGANGGPGGSDCASTLDCYRASSLSGIAATYASEAQDPNLGICCPPDLAAATTAICAIQPSPPGADAAPPPTPDAATDGPSEASETGAEDSSAPDAPPPDAPPPDASGDAPVEDSPFDASSDSPG